MHMHKLDTIPEDIIKTAMENWILREYGERCIEYDNECPTCCIWQCFDTTNFTQPPTENTETYNK